MPGMTEAVTRAKLVDPLLTNAGWNLKRSDAVAFEIPVDGYDKEPTILESVSLLP
jgi:type I site-specific restriction endonuclease